MKHQTIKETSKKQLDTSLKKLEKVPKEREDNLIKALYSFDYEQKTKLKKRTHNAGPIPVGRQNRRKCGGGGAGRARQGRRPTRVPQHQLVVGEDAEQSFYSLPVTRSRTQQTGTHNLSNLIERGRKEDRKHSRKN